MTKMTDLNSFKNLHQELHQSIWYSIILPLPLRSSIRYSLPHRDEVVLQVRHL